MTDQRDSVTAAELDETKRRLFRAMPGTRIPLDMQEGIELWGEVENSEEWEFCEKFGRELAALRRERDEAMREAAGLATALHRRWYYEVTQWRPITDSVAGVISQIDNMSAGIGQQLDAARADNAKKDAALREAHAHLSRRPPYNRGWNALLTQIEAALAPAAQGESHALKPRRTMLDGRTPPAPAPSAGETVLDWSRIAKAAGTHGVRYRTNSALEAFLREIAAAPTTGEPT